MPIVVNDSYREAVQRLHRIEGPGCYWRVALSAAAALAVLTIVLALATLTVWLGADIESPLRAIAAAAAGLLIPLVGGWLWQRAPWRLPIRRRLASFEVIDRGDRGVTLLLARDDQARASEALRRAKLNPAAARVLGTPPADAPALNLELTVFEPAQHHRGEVADLSSFVVDTLDQAGIRCRLVSSGVAIAPGSAWGLASPAEPDAAHVTA